jgi:hypothetical protein
MTEEVMTPFSVVTLNHKSTADPVLLRSKGTFYHELEICAERAHRELSVATIGAQFSLFVSEYYLGINPGEKTFSPSSPKAVSPSSFA